MIPIDPQQELFTKVKLMLEGLGLAVYDGVMPPDSTSYPFVHLGDMRQTDNVNKTAVFGKVFFTLHVWSDTPDNREAVSQMLLAMKTACRKLEHTDHFAWALRNVTQRILLDQTTATPLLHGILEVEYSFN